MIYTSGTTGFPKGAMLTHKNVISNYQWCATIPNYERDDRVLSFLPLCHIYERMLNYLFQSFGMSIYYAESIDKVGANIKEVKPHTFCAVPRVLEKTYDKIVNTGRGLKGIKRFLFFWALGLGKHYELHGVNGPWYEFKLKIADMLVFRKWRQALGNNIKLIVSGGAPLQPRIARVFWAAGIKIMEGYGLTETSPVIAVTNLEPDGFKFGTCGPVLPGVEVKLAGDGEIMTRGACIMKGYFNQPEETKAVIDEDGWFHTGDIGYFVDGRYLKITDRKKEIFKTSGGKYVAPQVIENKFKESSFIENLMVVGENRHHCIALILPNFDYLESWCRIKGHPFKSKEEAILDEIIINRIQKEVNEFNASLDKVEQIRKFAILADEWTVENGEFSPTLKLRRKYLLDKYSSLIEELYAKNGDD